MFECSSSKRLNVNQWCFGTLQIQCCFVLNTSVNYAFINCTAQARWRHLAKVSNLDFAFDNCYGNVSRRCWAESVWRGCWIKSIEALQQCIERWEFRDYPRSAWTEANLFFVGDLICSKVEQQVLQALGISERLCCLECILQQKGGHIKHISEWKWCLCSRFFTMFDGATLYYESDQHGVNMFSEQNDARVCKKSCKVVQALWRYGESNMVASVFWDHPVGDVCLSRKLVTGQKDGREKIMRRMKMKGGVFRRKRGEKWSEVSRV